MYNFIFTHPTYRRQDACNQLVTLLIERFNPSYFIQSIFALAKFESAVIDYLTKNTIKVEQSN